jgi:hypothetical protein
VKLNDQEGGNDVYRVQKRRVKQSGIMQRYSLMNEIWMQRIGKEAMMFIVNWNVELNDREGGNDIHSELKYGVK